MEQPGTEIGDTMKKIIATLAAAAFVVAACSTDADVANENIKKAAEQFEISRKITGINGITDEILLEVEGKCSFESQPQYFEVICRTDDNQFVRHVIGASDNTTWVVEQLTGADVSTSQYRFVIRPSAIIPDIDVE
jgi:predicted small secreted protein